MSKRGQNGSEYPYGQLPPNGKLNVKPGFAPGENGGAPDKGAAPQLKGAAKARQRSQESRADARMHSGDGHTTSGMDRALQAHVDQVHPVQKPAEQTRQARAQAPKRASGAQDYFTDEA